MESLHSVVFTNAYYNNTWHLVARNTRRYVWMGWKFFSAKLHVSFTFTLRSFSIAIWKVAEDTVVGNGCNNKEMLNRLT